MTIFEYLTVMVSLIMGLGIAHMLSGLARLIQARHRVRLYWVPLAWVGLIFVETVQVWWSNWKWRHYEEWNLFTFIFVLLMPIVLYMVAAVVLPRFEPDESIDLRKYYYEKHRWLFGMGTLLAILPIAGEVGFHGKPLFSGINCFRVVFFFLLGSAAFISKHWYHSILTGLVGVLFFIFLLLYTAGVR